MAGVKRNCWTCGHDDSGDCFILENQADGWHECEVWTGGLDWVARYPPKDSDGCPGWKPKPGAENTDRAQLASLADSATIRPDSATATVKGCLTVGLPDDRFLRYSGRRGPGGIMARKLRKL